jgi:hypothetical protein
MLSAKKEHPSYANFVRKLRDENSRLDEPWRVGYQQLLSAGNTRYMNINDDISLDVSSSERKKKIAGELFSNNNQNLNEKKINKVENVIPKQVQKVDKVSPAQIEKVKNIVPEQIKKVENIVPEQVQKVDKVFPAQIKKVENIVPEQINKVEIVTPKEVKKVENIELEKPKEGSKNTKNKIKN